MCARWADPLTIHPASFLRFLVQMVGPCPPLLPPIWAGKVGSQEGGARWQNCRSGGSGCGYCSIIPGLPGGFRGTGG